MNESQNKVIDKIEKLLALAGSDNENEAKSAMMKARELMASMKSSANSFTKARRKNGRSFTILRRRSAMIGVK